MAKQPVRLADFEIPRGEGPPPDTYVVQGVELPAEVAARAPVQAELANNQAPVRSLQAQAVADAVPLRIAPRPPAEARQAMTIRLPVSMHERIRTLMFVSRRSQQDIVEDALAAFLAANEV